MDTYTRVAALVYYPQPGSSILAATIIRIVGQADEERGVTRQGSRCTTTVINTPETSSSKPSDGGGKKKKKKCCTRRRFRSNAPTRPPRFIPIGPLSPPYERLHRKHLLRPTPPSLRLGYHLLPGLWPRYPIPSSGTFFQRGVHTAKTKKGFMCMGGLFKLLQSKRCTVLSIGVDGQNQQQ